MKYWLAALALSMVGHALTAEGVWWRDVGASTAFITAGLVWGKVFWEDDGK